MPLQPAQRPGLAERVAAAAPAVPALGKLPRRYLDWMTRSLDLISEMVVISEPGAFEDGQSRIVFVNQAFVRHTGYAPADVIGRNPGLLHGPRTDADAVARIRHALALRQSVRLDVIYHTRQGTPYVADVEVVPIKSAALPEAMKQGRMAMARPCSAAWYCASTLVLRSGLLAPGTTSSR